MIACRAGDTLIAKHLLDHGAKVNMKDAEGKSALHVVRNNGRFNLL